MPAFAKSGNPVDVSVSALGDAQSLQGGMLLQTPLRAANEQVYAVAQGSIIIGGEAKDAHTTVGRIPNGGMVEKDVQADFSARKMFRMTLHNPDFTTAARHPAGADGDLRDGAGLSGYDGESEQLSRRT